LSRRVGYGGREIVAKMKDMRTDDSLFGQGTIRADGQAMQAIRTLANFRMRSCSRSLATCRRI
jgi:hypothetical protein